MPRARTKARKRALDILFESEARDVDPLQVLVQRRATDDAPPVSDYAAMLVEGVVAHRDRIDQLLAEHAEGSPESLEELFGAMATAWLDDRISSTLFLARAVGRPLWVGTAGKELFFASTRAALEVLESTLRLSLRKRELEEGTLLRVEDGRVAATHRFRPDRSYVEETILPSVRAPHEGASCLQRLAAIALAA